jgi:hypothetical protein
MVTPLRPPAAQPARTGLYDAEGVLRFAGRDSSDCLAYAELFGLAPGTYSLSSLAA